MCFKHFAGLRSREPSKQKHELCQLGWEQRVHVRTEFASSPSAANYPEPKKTPIQCMDDGHRKRLWRSWKITRGSGIEVVNDPPLIKIVPHDDDRPVRITTLKVQTVRPLVPYERVFDWFRSQRAENYLDPSVSGLHVSDHMEGTDLFNVFGKLSIPTTRIFRLPSAEHPMPEVGIAEDVFMHKRKEPLH